MKEKMIRAADYVMEFLAKKGVKECFILPGGGAMHLDDAAGRTSQFNRTVFLHEQALGIAAESYGQHRNFPALALVTSGPGSTNIITPVTAGFIDSTPMFILSGQAKRSDLKHGTGVRQMGSQEVDIVSMISCVTKYAVQILEPEKIRYHLERAWHEMSSGRMGPVWLDIPLDVQGAIVDETQLEGFTAPAEEAYTIPVAAVKEMLESAKRPLMLIGNGTKLDNSSAEYVEFAEKYNIPVILTWKTIDLLGYDHPLNFGAPGIMGTRYANFIVQNCDCLLIAGSRLDPSLTAFNSADFGRNAKKIMVDIDPAEMRKIKGIDLQIMAPAKKFIAEIAQADIKMNTAPQWLPFCRELKEKYPVLTQEAIERSNGVDLYYFTEELFKALKSDDVIVPESSGAAGEVTYHGIKVKKGQKIKNAAGLGSMGFGLPYAVGAAIANERRRTVLINGDGAFQMNVQELETVVRLQLPVKMFIWDNDGYGSIVNTQRNMFGGFLVGSDRASGLSLPDVCKQAAAYGIRTLEVRSNKDLPAAIAETLAGDDPVLCKVVVTPDHKTMPKVQAEKLPDGRMISHPLEDMWPYLPAGEVKESMRFAEK